VESIDVVVFMQMQVATEQHCWLSAILVQKRIIITLCLLVLGLRGPTPTLSSFFTLHDPLVIARFLKACFEHRSTLVAAQSGHTLWLGLESLYGPCTVHLEKHGASAINSSVFTSALEPLGDFV